MGSPKNPTGGIAIILDVLATTMAVLPAIVTWATVIVYLRWIWDTTFFLLYLLATPLVLIATFLVSIRLLRASIKPPPVGVHRVNYNHAFGSWLCTNYLGQAIQVAGLKPLLFSLYTTRYLYWRALGAKIAYGVNCSPFINVSDLPLITIGKGTTIGAYSHISAHLLRGDRLIVAPVTIGQGVELGIQCVIGPGTRIGNDSTIGANCAIGLHTTIGEDVQIGAGNRLIAETIPDKTRIGHFEREYGDPDFPLTHRRSL
ncbi:MAG: DapH/DapD/GlmU-related protein [Acidobacteriota bacterium]